MRDFTPPPDARWQVLNPAEGDDIIVHHDLAPWNLVIGGTGAYASFDWDCAAPGSRLWDVAYAMHGFVPLSANPAWQRADAAARLRAFADAYGLAEPERRDLVPMLTRRTRSMYDFLRAQAMAGNRPRAALWAAGRGEAWRADAACIRRREHGWSRALLDS